MTSANYYRREAERCRDLADHSPDPEMARRWRALAADYDKLAHSLASSPFGVPQHAPMQYQPMQQQQARTEPDDQE
jgi:hypothetical protein